MEIIYIIYTKIWLGPKKKMNIIQREKFFDQATLNQESTVLWCPHDIWKTILSNQGPLLSWPSHIHNISILTILCGEYLERVLLQMFHLNFTKVIFFNRCTLHLDYHQSLLFTNRCTLYKTLKFTLKLLLYVSVYDHHQGAYTYISA